MTSAPVPESQNRYAALSVEECNNNNNNEDDTILKGCNNASPARAEAKAANPAGHEAESLSTLPLRKLGQTGAKRHTSSLHRETQPMKVLDKTSPTNVTPINTASLPRRTDGTWDESQDKDSHEALLRYKQVAQTFGSAITTTSVEPRSDGETTAGLPEQQRVRLNEEAMERPTITKNIPSKLTVAPESVSQGGTEETGNSAFAVQAQSIAHSSDPPSTALGHSMSRQTSRQEPQGRPSKAVGDAKATTTKENAAGQEAASTQAVNRGHSVTCIEVPDEDNDTAFQIWLAKERILAIAKQGDEPSSVPTTPSPTRWLKPFEVDWTLRVVCEARNDNAACATLFIWTHQDRIPELTPELLSELRKGGELAQERLYELREPPRYLRRRQSNSRDFMLNVQLTTCHQPRLHPKASPRHRGDITEYVEVRLAIGNHEERIDLAVTDLGTKDLYLGHDWLRCHNPVINWETGTVIFGRCQCVKNPFPLPDSDPDNCWDEELEDGDTILAVNMEEELVIHAVHHANDLAAAAHADKPTKTFEEMVPSDYRSFRDLFSKENFDELPE
ncbi:uncharacterized protein ARMOST_14264 [Armillaria ostoyae]|uniref:Uncharacterized protein n=1 Tax=Armillaria ostoyae TaxID=47428 RepID=A0A284RQ31_ARMOS|nr:uncharacterized protein ARMOST_14264 [Armillaria ostoyae]